MTQVHIYCRVSTSGQEDNTSLDTQEAACRAWAKERGLTVASVAREVWSGGDRHRPELDALIAHLTPGDIVLSYDLDRLSRGGQIDTAVIIDRIESAGATVAFVTLDFEKSETGALLRNVRAFAAALEREKIVERTSRGRRVRVTTGRPLPGWKQPYGFLWADAAKSHLIHDPETAGVVRFIFDRALDGVSLRQIGALLRERGIPSPTGAVHWSASSVRELLTRTMYAGTVTTYATKMERQAQGGSIRRAATDAERVVLPGIAEPIVTPEELATVAATLERNKTHSTRHNRHPERSLLRAGFIFCGHCGWALTVTNPTRASGSLSPQYRCAARQHHGPDCPRPTITASMIDPIVWDLVERLVKRPQIIAREVARHRNDGGLVRDLAAIEKRLAALVAKQQQGTKRLMLVDDDTAVGLIADLKALSDEKRAAEEERDALQQRIADAAADTARLQSLADWAETVSQNLDTLTYAEKRLALDALGVRVRSYRIGTVDETGEPYPRWVLSINPTTPQPAFLYRTSTDPAHRSP